MASLARRGNLQDLANRLDPEGIAVMVDEVLQDLSLRSSSARAKEALTNSDGSSVIYCTGLEPRQQRLELCEHKLDVNSGVVGVVTR
jgi:hypothetical protein